MKSDRVIWMSFFLILAVLLFVLFMLFGKKPQGPSVDPTASPDFSELGDFEDEDYSRPRQYQGRIQSESHQGTQLDDPDQEEDRFESSSPSYSSGFSSPGSGAKSEKRSKKFHSILAEYTDRRTRPPLSVRQDKLRKRLAEKGFKNPEYIEMRVMALNRKSAEEAIRTAAKLIQQDRDEEAMRLLKEELENTDPRNLVVRGLLIQSILGFAMDRGYPDTAMNYVKQLTAIRSRVNEIKMSTVLMNNPLARENLETERNTINQWQSNSEGFDKAIAYMREHKGFSPEIWRMVKGAGLNASRQFSDPKASREIPSAFRDLEDRVSRNWANPKE